MQEENCRNFNKKRKKAYQYEIGDIVAIQRTQFGTGLKLRPKFFGPYEVIKVKPKDRYDVRKIGLHEGPNTTSTAADHMKIPCPPLVSMEKKRNKYRCGQRTVRLVVVACNKARSLRAQAQLTETRTETLRNENF
ncbi:transposon Tf2-9 polyprotein [Trichonephila clavipes]|nr:transposon Tf2-9 polyprotein [Trichonephila clavipes]